MQNHKAKYQLQTTVDSCELVVFVLIEHDCYSKHRHLFPYMVYPNDPNYQVWKDIALIKSKPQYTTELTSSMSKYQEQKGNEV